MDKKLLVVIDMQNDFIDGPLGTPEAQAIILNVWCKTHTWEGDIIATVDTHDENYLETREGRFLPIPHCIKGTNGWEINETVKSALDFHCVKPLEKHGFASQELIDAAYGYNSITFIGLCTDICVISNALMVKNAFPEKDIYVDSSCCAGVTPAKHEAALEVMRSCQIEVY